MKSIKPLVRARVDVSYEECLEQSVASLAFPFCLKEVSGLESYPSWTIPES